MLKWYLIFLHRISLFRGKYLAGAGAIAFSFAIIVVFGRAGDGLVATLVAVIGALAFAVAGIIAGSGAFASAVIVAVTAAVSGELVFTSLYKNANQFLFFTAYILIILCNSVLLKVIKRAQKFQLHAEQNEELILSTSIRNALKEILPSRQKTVKRLQNLIETQRYCTVGAAGRRGLGKTNLLNWIANLIEQESQPNRKLIEAELKNPAKRRKARLRTVTFFLQTPTEFNEMGFLSALLQQFARRVNLLLTYRLPAVAPYTVERVLQEKRRILRLVHFWNLLLILQLVVTAFWLYQDSGRHVPFLQKIGLQKVQVQESHFGTQPSKLYISMRDSLSQELERRLKTFNDSFSKIDELLNPRLTFGSWNSESGETFPDSFLIKVTWDSLKKLASWPDSTTLDSVHVILTHAIRVLDSIAVVEGKYQSWQDSLTNLRERLDKPEINFTLENLPFYTWFLLVMFGFPWFWWRTREGDTLLKNSDYDSMRYEITLYERTNELIDRLQYQMSFGEDRETALSAKPLSFFGFSRKIARKVSREMRPFTIMSLTEEYRTLMREVIFNLNQALKEDERITGEEDEIEGNKPDEVKIIIAIDELDKVLDTKRLHEMLKSIKAIFDIPNVYYILSISEDALETYSLRHLETKNEIDSAFTHIFSIPPMDAAASLTFFAEANKKLNKVLFPAAIVFGGGVPRDMHRLLQLLTIAPQHETLEACLEALWKDDCHAAADVLKQNPKLSDEWKKKWIAVIEGLNCKTVSDVEAIISEVGELSLNTFAEENPSPEPEARQAFHHLRSLVRSMAIKSYIYAQTGKQDTPSPVKTWKKSAEAYYKGLSKNDEIDRWLKSLEPFRNAIFELSNNPLGVWEELKQQENDR